MKLTTEFINQGKAEYAATLTTENKMVRDETITSFGMAMKNAGYKPITTVNGCLITRDCTICRVGNSPYSTKYEKRGSIFWACPYCEELTAN